ncbi:dysbindin-like [Megalops cyprinoides]|uniref:dysbindin-like n=1 Tax=Megalops cyprinoides TaxID=118141 RepID=UPI0018640E26|nr:dysbindin-like [Megalops cyprinoides]
MSSSGSTNHNKRLSSETEHAQRVLDMDAAQNMKLRERQRFFEEVFQHDVDVYLSTAHLQIDHKRPPIGSISSMEVNVDILEQMELMDITDHEALDVFLNSSGSEDVLTSPLPGRPAPLYKDGLSLPVPNGCHKMKSRMSSTSSGSTDPYSLDTSEEGVETPVIQSDDEEVQADTLLLMTTPSGKDEEEEEEEEKDLAVQLP